MIKKYFSFGLKKFKKIPKRKKQFYLVLISTMIVALFWRVYQLNVIPAGLSKLELFYLEKASEIANGNLVIEGKDITTALYLYILALVGRISGFNIITFRYLQAFIGIITVFFFYLYVREWYNRKISIFATLFLAVNAVHTAVSRTIEPVILVPLLLILLLLFSTNALRTAKKSWFILSGLLCGLGLYVDQIFIFLPIIFGLSLIYLYYRNKDFFYRYTKEYLYGGFAYLLVAIPFFYFLPQNITEYRRNFLPTGVGTFLLNLGDNIRAIIWQAPPNINFYIGNEPLVSPFLAVAFLVGLIYALFHLERKQYYFMILLFTFLIVFISLGKPINNEIYLILLIPVIIFASSILDYIVTAWVKTFPKNKKAKVLIALVLSVFIALNVLYDYRKYFYAWGKNNKVKSEYSQQYNLKGK